MVSSVLSRVSALVLLVGGLALLFASDAVLPAIVSGYPASGSWLGQLLGAAWLGLSSLTWLQRGAVLGGIYGRPTVLANLTLYCISALSMLRTLLGHGAPSLLWFGVAIAGILTAAYGTLLLRGPFDTRARSAG